jgi:Tfp pilus assembly protein PilN
MSARRLELDFVAAPRRAQWAGVALLVVALAVAGGIVLRYRDAQRELASLETAQDLLDAGRRPARPIPRERIEEEAKQVDAIVQQLTLPWAQMIEALESASGGDVSVLQLQPEAQQRVLRITAAAKTRPAMLAYIRRLDDTRVLADVHLVSHQVQLDDPMRPIQFGVQASFRRTQ